MPHQLVPVSTPQDWEDVHHLRRTLLFIPERHLGADYDPNHPSDRAPANTLFVFKHDGETIGTVRFDVRTPKHGIVRLVAIRPTEQRKGHGRALDRVITDFARQNGIILLTVNAAPDAVGFYEKTGWHREVWDESELTGIARDCVQLVKEL